MNSWTEKERVVACTDCTLAAPYKKTPALGRGSDCSFLPLTRQEVTPNQKVMLQLFKVPVSPAATSCTRSTQAPFNSSVDRLTV